MIIKLLKDQLIFYIGTLNSHTFNLLVKILLAEIVEVVNYNLCYNILALFNNLAQV